MEKIKELKTLTIDVEKNIYQVNGENIENGSYLKLIFEDGEWLLLVTNDTFYSTGATNVSKG